MKAKYLIALLLFVLVEGILSQAFLLTMAFDPGRGHLFNYANLRLALAGVIFFVLAALMISVISLFRNAKWGHRLLSYLDVQLVGPKKRLFCIQGALIVTTVFLFECFLLTYLAFPVPTRPLFFWAGLTSFQVWLVFRIAYAGVYRERPSLAASLRSNWNGLLPVQRKVFAILAILGLIYFLVFIPFNLLRDSNGNFYLLGDEQVIYPDVVKVLNPQVSLDATVHNVLESWPWWYGYPYLPISASVLLIPRLIFGDQLAAHIQLNIGLMRQFVSVLPMVLALMLAAYLVTRYKSVLMSVSMFVFLLLVPGVVKINYQFWHPDSIILLLILLTIYFLQKDNLRFGRYFYLAAVACGLTIAIKLWGLFFVLAIAGYLLAGLHQKELTLRRFTLSGLYFILILVITIVVTSPSLLAPYITRVALESWKDQQTKILFGPKPVDPTGYYKTNLSNWLKYFGFHFMKGYFFFFAYFALVTGSLWGSRKYLNRILLAWCVATTIFLVYFSAMKNFQYMLPVAIPLYCGAFLFPNITEITTNSKWLSFLVKPLTRKIVWGLTIILFSSQFIINLIILYLFVLRGR
jgi:hypothetical protein